MAQIAKLKDGKTAPSELEQAYNKAYAGLDATTQKDWDNILAGVNNYSAAYGLASRDAAHVTDDARKYLLGTLTGDDYTQYQNFYSSTNASARTPSKNVFGRLHHDTDPAQSETGQIVRYVYSGYYDNKNRNKPTTGSSTGRTDWDWGYVLNNTGDKSVNYNSDATRIQAMNRIIQASLDRYQEDSTGENKDNLKFKLPHGFNAADVANKMKSVKNRVEAKKLWRDIGGDNEWIKQLFPEDTSTGPDGGPITPGNIKGPDFWGKVGFGGNWSNRGGFWYTDDKNKFGNGQINWNNKDKDFDQFYYVDSSGKLYHGNVDEFLKDGNADQNVKTWLNNQISSIYNINAGENGNYVDSEVDPFNINVDFDLIQNLLSQGVPLNRIRMIDYSKVFGANPNDVNKSVNNQIWTLGGATPRNKYGQFNWDENTQFFTPSGSVTGANLPYTYIYQGDNSQGTEDFPNSFNYEDMWNGYQVDMDKVNKIWGKAYGYFDADNRWIQDPNMRSVNDIISDLTNSRNIPYEQLMAAHNRFLQEIKHGYSFTPKQIRDIREIFAKTFKKPANNGRMIYPAVQKTIQQAWGIQFPTSQKQGGIIKAVNGTKLGEHKGVVNVTNNKDSYKSGYFGGSSYNSAEEFAAANTKMPDFTWEDWTRVGTVAADLGSLVTSFVPGYGTAVSAVLGLGSSVGNLVADIADDGFQWKDVGRFGINIALDTAGLIPGISGATTVAKIGKTVSKYAPKVLLGLTAIEGITNFDEYKRVFEKAAKGDFKDFTVEDWKTLSNGFSIIAGTSRAGASAFKGRRMQSNALKANSNGKVYQIDAKLANNTNGVLTDTKVSLNKEELDKLLKAPSITEANKILRRIGGSQDLELEPLKKRTSKNPLKGEFWHKQETADNPLAGRNISPYENIRLPYGIAGNENYQFGRKEPYWGGWFNPVDRARRFSNYVGRKFNLASDVDIQSGNARYGIFAPKQVKAPISTATPTSTPATKKNWYFGGSTPRQGVRYKTDPAKVGGEKVHLFDAGVYPTSEIKYDPNIIPSSISHSQIYNSLGGLEATGIYKQGGKFYTPINK